MDELPVPASATVQPAAPVAASTCKPIAVAKPILRTTPSIDSPATLVCETVCLYGHMYTVFQKKTIMFLFQASLCLFWTNFDNFFSQFQSDKVATESFISHHTRFMYTYDTLSDSVSQMWLISQCKMSYSNKKSDENQVNYRKITFSATADWIQNERGEKPGYGIRRATPWCTRLV